MRQPWERVQGIGGQRGESAKAFAAFCTYRDIPPSLRSIAQAVRLTYPQNEGKWKAKICQWEKWSSRWDWTSRSLAWDDERDRINRAEQLRAIEEMNKRHVAMAQMLQKVALAALQDLQRYIESVTRTKAGSPDALPQTTIRPHTLVNLFEKAAKMERIARSVPAEVSAVQVQRTTAIGHDVTTDEYNRLALEALKALAEQGLFSFEDFEDLSE